MNYIVEVFLPTETTFSIIHLTGYAVYPSIEDIKHLFDELKTDPEFGIGEQVEKARFNVYDIKYFKAIRPQQREVIEQMQLKW